jgi:HAD superfamily hydrolase (TIGR01549 family)
LFEDIEAVLFDMGGTLVDYPLPSWPVAIGQCLEGVYGHLVKPEKDLPPAAAIVPHVGSARDRRVPAGRDTATAHRATLALRRMIGSLSGRTLPRMAEACARTLVAKARRFEDALPTVRLLESRGYRLGIVSNTPWGTPEYMWENQINRFGLAGHFGVSVFSSGIGFKKPDSRIFQAALDRLGVPAARALFVGDDPQADIIGASRMGMRTAWLRRPGRPYPGHVKPWEPLPTDVRIRSLRDLADLLPARTKNT